MMSTPSSDDSRPNTANNRLGSRRISREIANLQQEIRDDFDQKLKELSGLMIKFRSILVSDGQMATSSQQAANDDALTDNTASNNGQDSNASNNNTPDNKTSADSSTTHRSLEYKFDNKTKDIDPIIDKNIIDTLADIPILTDRVADSTTDSNNDLNSVATGEKGNLRIVVNNDNNKAIFNTLNNTKRNEMPVKRSNLVSRFSTETARFETGLYQLNSQLYRFKLELDQELEFRQVPLHIHFQHQSELAKVLQKITEKMQQEKHTGP